MSREPLTIERGLARAERSIALIERCRPLGARTECARLAEAWKRGQELDPAWSFAPLVDLGGLRASLEAIATRTEKWEGVFPLLAARARELAIEAELAEQIGAHRFEVHAARRFPVDAGVDGDQALSWARQWAWDRGGRDAGDGIASDDESNTQSLISLMRQAVGERRLPFRVVVRPDLVSLAATGDGVIVIRSGARLLGSESERIVRHEVDGHAMPRARAKRERLGIFAVGTAVGSDDEEGRALLIEQRAGCLGTERRAELGQRHLAALAVKRGANFVETVRLLRRLGTAIDPAIAISMRVHRGGGLAREIVYLTALARVTRHFAADPAAEDLLERGRIAVAAVPLLREIELAHAASLTAAE